jgi:hypothetical protein
MATVSPKALRSTLLLGGVEGATSTFESLKMLGLGSVSGVERQQVSQIPGAERWCYGAFRQDHERRLISIPVVRDDGKSAEFTVPDFVNDPEDLRDIAIVVIGALEKWEAVKGLGA